MKKEECRVTFIEELKQALGGQEVLPDDWTTTAKRVLGVSPDRKADKET